MLPKQAVLKLIVESYILKIQIIFFSMPVLSFILKKGFYTHHASDYFREMIPHRNYQITAETYYFKAGYSFSAIGNHKKI